MRRLVIIVFVALGAFFGLVWWFDVEQTGGSFSDFFADPVGGTQSIFSRLGLTISGLFEKAKGAVGGTADPRALAASLIASEEGFVPHAYPDPPGQTTKYSIGYGHQIVPGDGFTTASEISETDALGLLQADLDTYVNCVENVVTVELAPEQRAALYDFAYNEGCAAFQGSTLLKDVNAGRFGNVQADLELWDKIRVNGALTDDAGLLARRDKEYALFASVAAPATTTDSGTEDTNV